MVSVKARGRQAVIRCNINHENLRLLRAVPNVKQWQGRDLLFEPTSQALDYIIKTWPDAEWDEGALKFRQVMDALRANAIPAPATKQQWDYAYKTKPFEHQEKLFKLSRDSQYFAYLMEQGTGKTKAILDNAAWLYAHGKIQGLLVVAKNGVHRNWVDNEIPVHMPDWCKAACAVWDAKKGEKAIDHLYKSNPKNPRIAVLAINVEALSTPRGQKVAERFLLAFPSIMVVDESTTIKTPGAKRTKAALRLGGFAPYRRILTGTPVTKGPLDVYTQFAFLDEDILGHTSYYSFRARYAVMRPLPGKLVRGRAVEVPVAWQNLDELQRKIAPVSFRVLKRDCLDLPDKLYTRRSFDMTSEQWDHYNNLVENMVTEFQDRRIAAPLAITRLMRLHQIACGYLPSDDPTSNPGVPINDKNPRIESLMEDIEEGDGKVIIYATYRACLRDIWNTLRENYGADSVVAYSGAVSQDERAKSVHRFQNDDKVNFFLGQTVAAGYGLTLTAAERVKYFNNDYNLEVRLQSEDRAHRIGQKNNVLYTDFEAHGTIDTDIIDSLKLKKAIADQINGDAVLEGSEWLADEMKAVDTNFIKKFTRG